MVAAIVQAEDFQSPKLGPVYDLIVRLHQAGRPVNEPQLLVAECQRAGIAFDGNSFLKLVAGDKAVVNAAHARYFAEKVRECSRQRGLWKVLVDGLKRLKAHDATADDVAGWLDSRLLSARHGGTEQPAKLGEWCDRLLDQYREQLKTNDLPTMMSGLPSADSAGFVFAPGELAVLAARPGIGKTTLATQIAMHHAAAGRTVLMASLEMEGTEVAARLLTSAAGFNHQMIRTRKLRETDISDMAKAAREQFAELPLLLWSPGRVKVGQIHAAASLAKQAHDLRLLIVDYIGLVRPDDRSLDRHEQVGEIVKGLRDIGKRLKIPVLALCQLNREADGQRPKLSNLRESGDIEQDADLVAFLHPAGDESTSVSLILAKNRQGQRDSELLLTFDAVRTRFNDPTFNAAFDQWNNGG